AGVSGGGGPPAPVGRGPAAEGGARVDPGSAAGGSASAHRARPGACTWPVDAASTRLAFGRSDTEPADPAGRVLVVALKHVCSHDRGPDSLRDGIGDRAGQSTGDRHGEEGAVDPFTVREPEADVARSARRVHLQLVPQTAEEPE